MDQKTLAEKSRYSRTMICMILKGLKRPGLQGSLRLERVTGIPVRTWAVGSPRQIRKEFERWASAN